MLAIRCLIWNTWNEKHIIRHGVIPDEVEEVCQHKPLVQRGKIRNRVLLIGETTEQRLLAVVLENRGGGNYYPVTAYDASDADTVLYERLRGGEDTQ
jgi:uncharacterized DUF497 family protein